MMYSSQLNEYFERTMNLLTQAAMDGNLDALRTSLSHVADSKVKASEALSLAAQNGHAECVELLIPVSTPADLHSCALRMAAGNGHVKCLKLLIPVSNPARRDSEALRSAAENGHTECVNLLISIPHPKSKYSEALSLAVQNGHAECVAALIPISNPKVKHSKALSLAAQNGHTRCVELLMPVSNIKSALERLHQAVEKGTVSHIISILEKGCPPDLPSKNGSTPLRRAVERGKSEITEILLSYGADPFIKVKLPGYFNDDPNTPEVLPFHLALRNANIKLAERILDFMLRDERRKDHPDIDGEIREGTCIILDERPEFSRGCFENEKTMSYILGVISGTEFQKKRITFFHRLDTERISTNDIVREALMASITSPLPPPRRFKP